jgi:multidrug efflux pump subunit AcrA (membrane-fusion protein)
MAAVGPGAARALPRARALADYARITAPFDGVVVRRNVDVGDFVQNAERGPAEPLMTVARTDIVTVFGKLPDNVAPFISRNTTVQILMDDLPGVTIEGRVTRYAPAIQSQDRTMRVEVDLYNGSLASWQKLEARTRDEALSVLGGGNPLTAAALVGLGEAGWSTLRKGASEGLPTYPRAGGQGAPAQLLLPGMTGTMRVELRQFNGGCLLPAGAVFNRGGKSYVLQVTDGVTRLVPVRVQVNDGVLAKVVVVGDGQEPRELTGAEEIVRTRQTEIGEGRKVAGAVEPW